MPSWPSNLLSSSTVLLGFCYRLYKFFTTPKQITHGVVLLIISNPAVVCETLLVEFTFEIRQLKNLTFSNQVFFPHQFTSPSCDILLVLSTTRFRSATEQSEKTNLTRPKHQLLYLVRRRDELEASLTLTTHWRH
ncbi:hypothetical protein VTL71DRAFT_15394 [Oculimacula yallundae]|uniref:Secreted protein n=1 Tax=Oculimacula yallundae TaxID=86028 RepID=A0ABR4CGF7_9HELO